MRIPEAIRQKVIDLDRRYRSTWDTRAIAHTIGGISHSSAAAILRTERGPRPKRPKAAHNRRTRFLARDVMWSSDFMRVGWGWLLLKTMDEISGYVLNWGLVKSEYAAAVLDHAESILERMGRAPLVWKYDHGSAFTSEIFQGLLEERRIVPYPIAPRSPWVNGRMERDHQEVHNWLIPLAGRQVSREDLEREIDEEMLVRNFIKPRACLGFKKSAETYFSADATLEAPTGVRDWLAQGISNAKSELGAPDPEEVYEIRKSGERLHRKAVRMALQRLGVYEEWEEKPKEAKSVNRSRA